MILQLYLVGGVMMVFGIIYTSKRNGTITDGLIPMFAIISGVIWPLVVFTGIHTLVTNSFGSKFLLPGS